jgi:hypothetical protein
MLRVLQVVSTMDDRKELYQKFGSGCGGPDVVVVAAPQPTEASAAPPPAGPSSLADAAQSQRHAGGNWGQALVRGLFHRGHGRDDLQQGGLLNGTFRGTAAAAAFQPQEQADELPRGMQRVLRWSVGNVMCEALHVNKVRLFTVPSAHTASVSFQSASRSDLRLTVSAPWSDSPTRLAFGCSQCWSICGSFMPSTPAAHRGFESAQLTRTQVGEDGWARVA